MAQQQQEQKPPRQKSDLQLRLESFENYLVKPNITAQLAKALPNAASVSQEIELVKNTIRRTPKLLMCTRESLFAAVVQVFELGLKPVPALGHAYFIPFETNGRLICQLIIGYRGLIELSRRSGVVSSIRAEVVYQNDYFRYRLGLDPQLDHVPFDVISFDDAARAAKRGQTATEPGPIIAAYCVVSLKDGTKEFRVVTNEYIQRIKKVSRGSSRADSPWKQWEDQMWAKTAVRHTLKFVPLSPEDRLVKGLEVDERAFTDIGRSIDTTGTSLSDTETPEPVSKNGSNGRSTTPSTDDDPLGDVGTDETPAQSGLDRFVSNNETRETPPVTDAPSADKPAQPQDNPQTESSASSSGDPPPNDAPASDAGAQEETSSSTEPQRRPRRRRAPQS